MVHVFKWVPLTFLGDGFKWCMFPSPGPKVGFNSGK